MKVKIIRLVIPLLLILTVGGGLFAARGLRGSDHGELISCRKSFGGDMRGSSSTTCVKKINEEKALVYFTNADWHYMDESVSEYLVSASLLTDIEEVFDSKKMYRYPELPDSGLFAYDAGSTSYCFSFADGRDTAFDSNQEIPSGQSDGLMKIEDLIQSACMEGEKLPGLVTKEAESIEDAGRRITEGELVFSVYEYLDGSLYYRFANGKDEDIPLEGSLILCKSDEKETQICEAAFSFGESAASMNFYEFAIKPKERLEAGFYRLYAGDYFTDFEIR